MNTTTGEIQQSFAGELIGPAGSAAMNPAGTFLVTVGEGFHIAVYAINGQNAPTETSALTGNGAGGSQTLFTPNGQFLYSGAIFGGMGAYSLDSSGKLAMVPGSPFTPGGYPLGITPDGKFLYALAVPNGGSDPFSNQTIEVFSIDSTSGALTLVSGATEIPSVGHPTGNPSQRFLASAFTHSGHILFLGDHTTGNVYGFALNSSTGKATLASTTTVETAPPTAMTLSPDDSHLYVADGQDILGFSVNSNGTLAPLNGGALMATIPPSVQQSNSSPALFTVVDDVQVDLTGKFLYVLTPDELFAFNIGSNGILSPDSGANLIAPNAPFNRPWGELTFANLQ